VLAQQFCNVPMSLIYRGVQRRRAVVNRNKFPFHGLGIAVGRWRKTGKRGFGRRSGSSAESRTIPFFSWRLSAESRYGFPLSAFRFPL